MYKHHMENSYTAFAGAQQIANGSLQDVTLAAKSSYDAGLTHLLIFDDLSGRQIDVDLRNAASEIKPNGPLRGRPRLGVTSREVTLLPRHWEWLADQPGGASAALRRLVDQAENSASGLAEKSRTAAYRIMLALAGDLPGYEEANRALFAGDLEMVEVLAKAWPRDISAYVQKRIEELRALLETP